ncbi:hypothetical protein PG994_006507 [Apiospora phragmitis]|uniref:Rhodopsin domain-containing protein n=1 Tax=Apiospora phragmitis TaxID=2905665 RepID=A0ABR1VHW5_9PEZI
MESRQPEIYGAVIITLIAATSALVLRLIARRMKKLALWFDDYLAIVAWGLELGLGLHLDDLHISFDLADHYRELFQFILEHAYTVSIAGSQLSILALYWRAFGPALESRMGIVIIAACSISWFLCRLIQENVLKSLLLFSQDDVCGHYIRRNVQRRLLARDGPGAMVRSRDQPQYHYWRLTVGSTDAPACLPLMRPFFQRFGCCIERKPSATSQGQDSYEMTKLPGAARALVQTLEDMDITHPYRRGSERYRWMGGRFYWARPGRIRWQALAATHPSLPVP